MTGILLFSHIYFFQKPNTYENLNLYVMYHSSVNKYSQINKTKTSNNNRNRFFQNKLSKIHRTRSVDDCNTVYMEGRL